MEADTSSVLIKHAFLHSFNKKRLPCSFVSCKPSPQGLDEVLLLLPYFTRAKVGILLGHISLN